ncbi:MAG: hypothetical protein J6H18_05700 [Lachnospiraceae bacterium]|nr:hypothetical protein [Lachnospiraceae bacterium]
MKASRLYRKAGTGVLLAGILLFLAFLTAGCGSEKTIKVPFCYQSGVTDEKSYFYYRDSFFDHSSTEYDPSLATASLSFSLAAFASTKGEDYSHRYQNIEAVYEKCGFTDLYVNQDYQKKPGPDSLGVVIAQKQLGDKTLLALDLRGANYESEWASNFTIGKGEEVSYHQGFYEASESILQALKHYVESRELKGELKLWMKGYSRAGASCNLAAGRINEYIRDGVAFLGDQVSLKHEDFYAYCFESPRGVVFDESVYPKSQLFGNIFCIVNRNDPVPKVVMEAMGFTRFGVEIVLPDSVTVLNFDSVLKRVKAEYGTLRSFGDWGSYQVDSFQMMNFGTGNSFISLGPAREVKNWTQGLYLDEILDLWTREGIRDRLFYAETIQHGMRELFRLMYIHKTTSSSLKDLALQLAREIILKGDLDVLIDDLLHGHDHLIQDLKPLLNRALLWMVLQLDSDEVVRALVQLFYTFAQAIREDFGLLFSLLSLDNIKAVASAHYPELCLAFLRVMDPLYTRDPLQLPLDGAYYRLTAPAGTNLKIWAGEQLVAGAEGGLPLDCDSLIPCSLRGSEIRIFLPAHESYRVEASAPEGISLLLVEPSLLKNSEIDPLSLRREAEGRLIPAQE